jgi:thioredoxin-related protein
MFLIALDVSSDQLQNKSMNKKSENKSLYVCMFKETDTCEYETCENLKNAIFWDVTLCGSCKNRCFGGT